MSDEGRNETVIVQEHIALNGDRQLVWYEAILYLDGQTYTASGETPQIAAQHAARVWAEKTGGELASLAIVAQDELE